MKYRVSYAGAGENSPFGALEFDNYEAASDFAQYCIEASKEAPSRFPHVEVIVSEVLPVSRVVWSYEVNKDGRF